MTVDEAIDRLTNIRREHGGKLELLLTIGSKEFEPEFVAVERTVKIRNTYLLTTSSKTETVVKVMI
jgi:hypothetical protein